MYSVEEIFSCDEEVFSAAEEVSHGGVILFVVGCELDRDELSKELCRGSNVSFLGTSFSRSFILSCSA